MTENLKEKIIAEAGVEADRVVVAVEEVDEEEEVDPEAEVH